MKLWKLTIALVAAAGVLAISGLASAQPFWGAAGAGIGTPAVHNANVVRYASQDRINQYFFNQCGCGCNTGCTTGCDTGCSSGCDTGCNTGCDTGCNTGCNCNKGCNTGCDTGCGTGCDADLSCNTGCYGKSWLSGKSLWGNYVTRSYNVKNHAGSVSNGFQVGMDVYTTKTLDIGVLIGYEKYVSPAVAEAGGLLEADDTYFGIYGAKVFNCGNDMRVYMGYGGQKWKNQVHKFRDSQTFETTLEFGRRCYINRCLSYRPVIALDWYLMESSQVNGAAPVGQHTDVYARIGSDLQYNRNCWNVNGGLWYAHNMSNNDVARVVGREVITLSAGATWYLDSCKNWSVFANYYGDIYCGGKNVAGDRTESMLHTGMVGLSYKF